MSDPLSSRGCLVVCKLYLKPCNKIAMQHRHDIIKEYYNNKNAPPLAKTEQDDSNSLSGRLTYIGHSHML